MKLGSLFSGYGGLDQAIHAAFGDTTTAWVSDFDTGPNKILAHRYPNVPNIGDLTQIDWTAVEPVEIIAGGFPCQDVSLAGRRAGMTEGTRSNLWGAMRTAIETIRTRYVVAENVRGLLSATANSVSDMEPGGGPLGDGRADNLRALGRVLGDLADLGYDAGWCGLRAADVGAPHGRFRVFIVAEDALRSGDRRRSNLTQDRTSEESDIEVRRANPRPDPSGDSGLRERDNRGSTHQANPTKTLRRLRGEARKETVQREAGGLRSFHAQKILRNVLLADKNPSPSGYVSLESPQDIESERVRDMWSDKERPRTPQGPGCDQQQPREPSGAMRVMSPEVALEGRRASAFGPYETAISRWEKVLGRPAPFPLIANGKYRPRLNPAFSEWMMGLPEGWVTDTPGITRNEALKALGNGVVPQQGTAAIRHLLNLMEGQTK